MAIATLHVNILVQSSTLVAITLTFTFAFTFEVTFWLIFVFMLYYRLVLEGSFHSATTHRLAHALYRKLMMPFVNVLMC